MNTPSTIQLLGAVLFAVAMVHTFSTKFFEHLAHTRLMSRKPVARAAA